MLSFTDICGEPKIVTDIAAALIQTANFAAMSPAPGQPQPHFQKADGGVICASDYWKDTYNRIVKLAERHGHKVEANA